MSQLNIESSLLQELFVQLFTPILQILEAQKQAMANNMTVGTDMSSIFSAIKPLSLIQDILKTRPARSVIPNTPAGNVNDACYRDVMDMLDSVVATKGWAIQSK